MDVMVFARHLKQIRENKGWTQNQLATEINNYLLNKELASTTIAAYEQGARYPKLPTIVAIATLFKVSVDWLIGVNENMDIQAVKKGSVPSSPIEHTDVIIPRNEWYKYDKSPVYVVSSNTDVPLFQPCWGILDYDNKRILSVVGIINIKDIGCNLYRYKPSEADKTDTVGRLSLSINELKKETGNVWVEVLNTDSFTKGQYNGWYKSNENRSMLINISNGLTLPYNGIGISFRAYKI